MLAVIKMVLHNVKVFGVPIHLETASSKAEAIQILDHYAQSGGTQQLISVVFLDVVMESNSAGLEVAEYIRNVQKNYVTQIYIVTGQPGVAPEREVIDRYNISGYVGKPEADETKLYSLVKSGIREANMVSNAVGNLYTIEYLLKGAGSKSAMLNIMFAIGQAVMSDPECPCRRPDRRRALDGRQVPGRAPLGGRGNGRLWSTYRSCQPNPSKARTRPTWWMARGFARSRDSAPSSFVLRVSSPMTICL